MEIKYPYIITLPHLVDLKSTNIDLSSFEQSYWRLELGKWIMGKYHMQIAFIREEDAVEFKLRCL